MSAVQVDAGTISGETETRSSTALTSAVSRGGSAGSEITSVIGADAETNEGEASVSFISRLMNADSCHGPLNDKDVEGCGSNLAAELFWEAILSGAIPLVTGTGVCDADKSVSSNEPEEGGTIFLVTIKE